MTSKPPTVVELTWIGDLKFTGVSAGQTVTIDGDSKAAPSPVQALAFAVAGCMTTDVAHMLQRGRHPFHGLRARLVADRAQADPHRFVRLTLEIVVEGTVPPDAVDRAVALSRDKYCSVWHSMRQDIELTVTTRVVA